MVCVSWGSAVMTAPPISFLPALPMKKKPLPPTLSQIQGIIVRHPRSYKLPQALRITVGRPEDNTRVLAALTEFTAPKETA